MYIWALNCLVETTWSKSLCFTTVGLGNQIGKDNAPTETHFSFLSTMSCCNVQLHTQTKLEHPPKHYTENMVGALHACKIKVFEVIPYEIK